MYLPGFDKTHIVTVGDVMLDRYWHGTTERVSAEAPLAVVDVKEVEDRLGGAANVALNIAALGAVASLIGAVARDEFGRVIRQKLTGAGIRDGLQDIDDYQTSAKFRIISRKQQIARADFERIADMSASHFSAVYANILPNADGVILSDYDKGVLGQPAVFIALARKAKVPVLVDPKFKDFSSYRGATLIKPNQQEFQAAVGSWSSEAELVQKAQALILKLGLEAILVTRGAKGMTLVQTGQAPKHLSATGSDVFDVSGAGDTVIAVLATALASGQTMYDAVRLANIAAGIVVGQLGTASISGPELALKMSRDAGYGILPEEQLLLAVKQARSRGESIVFTNGCFDILHAGHVAYLAEARQQGDRLIVAVNSDRSVRRLKGAARPINNIQRRMSVLAGLSAVDWVVSFASDTPEPLLRNIQPDVLVKGGDYGIDAVVGADIVLTAGGSVKVLKLVEGLSTTALTQKIKAL